jgi:hypothetical protein
MINTLLTTVAVIAFAGPALAQAPQYHQQHHPGGSAAGSQAQVSPAQPATSPSPSQPQPPVQVQVPTGGMMHGMGGMMPGQGQSGSMMEGQSGMTMSCPMMQSGMRGMMGGQGMAGGTGAGGMIPMMVGGGHMMKVMFAVADTNGDAALSFEEITAIHKRIFDRVDTSKDGKVTVEELQSFMRE